jgi:hypothetical protein
MVVDNLDIMSVPVTPDEAHAPLIIDSDRVLPAPIALQSLQTVGRWRSQIEQGGGTEMRGTTSREHP